MATGAATVAVEAKPDLEALLARMVAGETVRLTRAGAVVARLEPVPAFDPATASDEEIIATIKRNREARRLGDVNVEDLISDGRE